MEIITPDTTTTFVRGELDWAVLIENPTTPNTVYWRTADGSVSGSFFIDGPTEIPLADRTYDLSMAVKKACLQLVHKTEFGIQYENPITTRKYTAQTKMYDPSGNNAGTVVLNDVLPSVIADTETIDQEGNINENNRIIRTITKFNGTKYLITKRYISTENGLEFNQVCFYISSTTSEADAVYCIFIKLDTPLSILNSSKLPHADHYSYKLTILVKTNGVFIPQAVPISNSDDSDFRLIEQGQRQFIRWNLTSYTESQIAMVPKNEFVYQVDIEINPADKSRDFINTDPLEYRTYFYFKFGNGSAIESTITLI
jgi:hypothetical protein